MSSSKFNCAIISSDTEAAAACSKVLAASSAIGNIDWIREYPEDHVFTRMLRLNAMDLLVLDCEDLPRTLQIIEQARRRASGVEILAVCQEDVKILSALMRAGVRDYIPVNAPRDILRSVLASAIEKMRERPAHPHAGGDIVAFLPSKPGSGTSTIAANTAFAASKSPQKRVLLSDFDRDAPVQAFLNKLHPEHYLQEALVSAHQMDEDLWSRLRTQREELDILPADADGTTCKSDGTQELLGFFRRAYDLTCVDLPGSLDPCSVEVIMESKRVYLVCTQELASVHIALRKTDRLRRLGLGRELRLILNRYESGHVMTESRVSDLVGIPVDAVIPNSYKLANHSAENGSYVDPATPLGKSYQRLAKILFSDRIEIPPTKRKFIDFLYQPFAKTSSAGA